MSPEIPHAEQVQNIQDIMVYVQGDSSTFNSTMLWVCQLVKTKQKFTALLPVPFVPSSWVWQGILGLEGGGGFEYVSFGFWDEFFLKEMDYVWEVSKATVFNIKPLAFFKLFYLEKEKEKKKREKKRHWLFILFHFLVT